MSLLEHLIIVNTSLATFHDEIAKLVNFFFFLLNYFLSNFSHIYRDTFSNLPFILSLSLCPSHESLSLDHVYKYFCYSWVCQANLCSQGFWSLLVSNWFKIEDNDFFCVKILKYLTAIRLNCLALIKVYIVYSC